MLMTSNDTSHASRTRHRQTRRLAMTKWITGAVLVLAVPGVPAAPVHAQAVADVAGLHGTVVDARTGEPLDGATVSLERLPAGTIPVDDRASGGFLALARRIVTAADGIYTFNGLAPGEYRLRVVRLGYRPATFDVYYDGPADPRISVGLQVEPIALEPVTVYAGTTAPLQPAGGTAGPGRSDRVALERRRQDRFADPDSRVITNEDMTEAVTLGEVDLLRVLHRLPGVTTEDDFSAEPWTRGSRWDETRVYFDGLPLFDPMHAGGMFTSISPNAVGALTFHPGVRPADAGEAAAGVVDLRSRRAGGEERVTLFGQLSVFSASLAADRPWGPGNGIAVSARRSYIEELATTDTARRGGSEIPYGFSDLSGRLDHVLTDSIRLEISGLRTRNHISGDLPYALKGARGEWGSSALRGTIESTLVGLRTRITRGASESLSEIAIVPFDENRQDLIEAVTAADTWNRIRSDMTEVTIVPLEPTAGGTRWQLGGRRLTTRISYSGAAPWPYPDAATAGSLDYDSEVERYSWWGTVRHKPDTGVDVSAGLRLETRGRPSEIGNELSLAPRFAVAWRPRPALRLSIAAGRHFQYEQAIAATGFTVGSALVPGHLWVNADRDTPPIRSDILTAGAELWLSDGWLLSANAWMREATGRLMPSPAEGTVRARPAVDRTSLDESWVAGVNEAAGIEVGARRLAGRWTGSVAASVSRSRMTAAGHTFDAPGQRTYELDAALLHRAGEKTTLGAAFTAMSGAAYTRFYAFRCTAVTWYCAYVDKSAQPIIGFAETAGGQRTAPYASLDLHMQRTGTLFGLPFGFYGQIRNALLRDNRSAYSGSIQDCEPDGTDCVLSDNFEDGFRFIPLIGFWIRR